MPCLPNSHEELKSYIKNKRAIYTFSSDSTYVDINEAIKHSKENFGLNIANVPPKEVGDDLRRYTLRNSNGGFTDAFLSSRVSDKVNKLFKRGKTEAEVEAYKVNKNNIIKREFGSKGHQILELLGKAYYDSKLSGKPYSKDAIYKEAANGEYKFRPIDVDNLELGVKEIVDEIFALQAKIDSSAKPFIHFEAFIADPTKDMGGTMDVFTIFSNKTAITYDYKFLNAGSDSTFGTGANKILTSDGFIHGIKKEGWKLQQGTYKKILLERYGIADVLATKIAPVWIDFAGKIENKKLNKVRIGKQQSEYLKHIHATYAKTGIEEIDKLLKSRYTELERLKRQTGKTPIVKEKIKAIEQSIYDLVEEHNIETMINNALNVAKEYMNVPVDTISFEELNNVIQYLQTISGFQQLFEEKAYLVEKHDKELYDNIIKVLKKQYGANVTGYDKLRNIRSIYGLLLDKRVEKLVQETGIEIRDEAGNIALSDDDALSKMFLSTSELQNEIYQIAQNSFSEAHQNTRTSLQTWYDKLSKSDREVSIWLKSRGESYSDLYKHLLDPTTGNMFGRVSKEFYKQRTNAKVNKDANWFVKHYDVRETNAKGETYKDYYERTKREIAEFWSNNLQNLKEENEAQFRKEVGDKIANWITQNSLELNADGTPKYPEAWLRSYWIKLKPAILEANKSKEYAFIESHPALLNYFNTLQEFNRESREVLGYSEIPSNFLPKVRADVIEKMQAGGFKPIIEDISQFLNIRQDDTEFGHQDIDTGEFVKRVPIFYTNPFQDADGNIDLQQQSKDITKSYLLFAKMLYNHKYMTEIEAKILAMKEMLKVAKYDVTNEKGGKVFDFMHNMAKAEDSDRETSSLEVFNNIVDHHLYGIRVQPFQGKKQLTKLAMNLKNFVSMKTLGLSFVGSSAGYLAAQLQAITEGKKGVIYKSEHYTNATKLQATQYDKYHAFAYFFGVHNDDLLQQVAQGPNKVQNWLGDRTTKDAVRSYITQRTLMRPYSYFDERLDNHISVAMAQNYGIDENGNLKRLVNLPEDSKSIWDMFQYNKKDGDIKFGNLTDEGLKKILIAFRTAVRHGQKGIKGTVNEEDINYAQTHLILNLMSQFKSWMPGIINERFGKLRYNKLIDAPQWGRYRALWDENEFKQSAGTAMYVARTTANMLTYIAKDLITFGGVRRSFFGDKVKIDDSAARQHYEAFKQLNPKSELTFDEYIEVKRAAIRASLMEAQIFISFLAVIAMLGSDWDDDDIPMWRETWAMRQVYRILNKSKSEIAFTFNPTDYAKLLANPLPMSSLFVDTAKLLNNTVDESMDILFGEERLIGGTKSNDPTSLTYYSLGFIPGMYQIRRFFELFEVDERRDR